MVGKYGSSVVKKADMFLIFAIQLMALSSVGKNISKVMELREN